MHFFSNSKEAFPPKLKQKWRLLKSQSHQPHGLCKVAEAIFHMSNGMKLSHLMAVQFNELKLVQLRQYYRCCNTFSERET